MGVMLFPSFWLGNALAEGGGGRASFAPHSLFFSLSSSPSSIPLLPSFLFSLLSSSTAFSSASSSLFLSPLSPFFFPLFFSPYHTPFFFFKLLPSLFHFHFPLSFHYVLLLCLLFFFLRELLVLSVFQDVNEDITDCNRM